MDTTTVLEVIKMIDMKISYMSKEHAKSIGFITAFNSAKEIMHELDEEHRFHKERVKPLEDLSNHLQSYIDGQVNAVENQSAEQ